MKNLILAFKYAFKDLTQQKIRAGLGTVGVMISVGLLAIILFLSDSISISYVNFLATGAGNQDMVINVRHYNGEPENRSTYFHYEEIIDQIEDVSDDIDEFIPRMNVEGKVNRSGTSIEEEAVISGIDFSLEDDLNFGTFVKPDTNEEMDLDELELYHCAIFHSFNDDLDYEEDDSIKVFMTLEHGREEINKTVILTVDKIFDQEAKWPIWWPNNLIVVDIETLYNIFGYNEFKDRCSQLILTFKNPGDLYDTRDIEGSKRKVKEIAGEIQKELGVDGYNIYLPKLRLLEFAEFLMMGITVIFVFVSIVAMLIVGILINGILKTSVEERIREFGVFRTLGAQKKYNLLIVLLQGFLLCNFGAAIGIVWAFAFTQYIVVPFTNEYLISGAFGESFGFSFSLLSIIIPYSMGVGVGLLVSISPALKASRLQIIESIHPYRHEDALYNLKKKASINSKLVIVGLVLIANSGFIFYILPRLFLSLNITLLATTFIVLLLIFLIGLTLAGLGLMPIVLRGTIYFFRLSIFRTGKIIQVIKLFVFRYQRRNSSTIITFALSFSFITFTSIFIQTQQAQVATQTRLEYGSDILMQTTEWEEEEQYYQVESEAEREEREEALDPSRIMTTAFKEQLLEIKGIEKVSCVIATPFQLTQIYSEEDKDFEAEIGDYAGLSMQDITLIGIDEEYISTINTDVLTMTQGEMDDAFDTLLEKSHSDYTCIISEGIAIQLKVELGDRIRILIQRGDESEKYTFNIVGAASGIPGFPEEFSSTRQGSNDMGGVLISHETYLEIIDIPEPAWVDKIFIKLREDKLSEAEKIVEKIDDLYQNNYDYEIYNLEFEIESQAQGFQILDALFNLILTATVIICLFGLLSSSYSTIIERFKEIGIVRTLGLKGKEVNRMFIIEALIIMIASGSVGVIVGGLTGWLVTSNFALFTDTPYTFVFPFINILLIYLLSIGFIYIGMFLMLRRIRKQKIIDIYRENQ